MIEAPDPQAALDHAPRPGLAERLFTPRVGAMLWRNTVVSCFVFVIGLAVTYALVERMIVNTALAGGIGFLVANSLHYFLGRSWIFRGSQRGAASGYALFLVNALVGFVVTTQLYALCLMYMPVHYLISRVIVSVFAGLAVFVLNAVFTFRRV